MWNCRILKYVSIFEEFIFIHYPYRLKVCVTSRRGINADAASRSLPSLMMMMWGYGGEIVILIIRGRWSAGWWCCWWEGLDFEEDVALAVRWSIKEKFRRGKRNKFIWEVFWIPTKLGVRRGWEGHYVNEEENVNGKKRFKCLKEGIKNNCAHWTMGE
jgi:hypothetical protein